MLNLPIQLRDARGRDRDTVLPRHPKLHPFVQFKSYRGWLGGQDFKSRNPPPMNA